MKQGVQAALDRLADRLPEVRYAVVFDTDWHPVQPPEGSEWDYEPFYHRQFADQRMRQMRRCEREPELWEHVRGHWRQT